MAEVNKFEETSHATALGKILIANEVVAVIAGLAATEIDGIAGMSGGVAGGVAEMLGRRNLARGVKVDVGEHEAAVDLFIIVDYGMHIPDLALRVQGQVKQAIENMAGLAVIEVNVHVQGVHFAEGQHERQRLK
jgi:uncharacterized alkaline shock family protein YloU